MRVHRIAELISFPSEIIPYNWTIEQKLERLSQTKDNDIIVVQKWRNDFNRAEFIQPLRGIKIFDIDDICEDKEVLDLANASDVLFVANHFLQDWAKQFQKRTFLIPTGVDIPSDLPPFDRHGRKTILIAKYGVDRQIVHLARIPGWQELNTKYGLILRILGTVESDAREKAEKEIGSFAKTYPLVKFSQFWHKYGKMVSTATIGIMPLGRNAQGKSAFSVLTMMAAGLPVIASPYGECDHIIKHGLNGFLATKPDDWQNYAEQIIENPVLRGKLSVEAFKTIIGEYSIEVVAQKIEHSLKEIYAA